MGRRIGWIGWGKQGEGGGRPKGQRPSGPGRRLNRSTVRRSLAGGLCLAGVLFAAPPRVLGAVVLRGPAKDAPAIRALLEERIASVFGRVEGAAWVEVRRTSEGVRLRVGLGDRLWAQRVVAPSARLQAWVFVRGALERGLRGPPAPVDPRREGAQTASVEASPGSAGGETARLHLGLRLGTRAGAGGAGIDGRLGVAGWRLGPLRLGVLAGFAWARPDGAFDRYRIPLETSVRYVLLQRGRFDVELGATSVVEGIGAVRDGRSAWDVAVGVGPGARLRWRVGPRQALAVAADVLFGARRHRVLLEGETVSAPAVWGDVGLQWEVGIP